jgi:hypothetical protein
MFLTDQSPAMRRRLALARFVLGDGLLLAGLLLPPAARAARD